MVRNYTAYLLLLCLLPVAGVGGTITDLYQAEAPIESLQPESRRPAIRAALGAPRMRGADLCPDCGHHTLVYQEGCNKCYSCGYSDC